MLLRGIGMRRPRELVLAGTQNLTSMGARTLASTLGTSLRSLSGASAYIRCIYLVVVVALNVLMERNHIYCSEK